MLCSKSSHFFANLLKLFSFSFSRLFYSLTHLMKKKQAHNRHIEKADKKKKERGRENLINLSKMLQVEIGQNKSKHKMKTKSDLFFVIIFSNKIKKKKNKKRAELASS